MQALYFFHYKLWMVEQMSIYQKTENQVSISFHAVLAVWIMFFTLTSVGIILVMPNTSAHSMIVTADQILSDVETLQTNSDPSNPSSVLAPVLSDPCLSLLHSVSAPPSNRNQRNIGAYAMNQSGLFPHSQSRGKAEAMATLGLMLSVRLAIEPHTQAKSTSRTKDTEYTPRTTAVSTDSIIAYRYCKKDLALKSLSKR